MVSRYELAKNFKVGQKVRIKNNIDITVARHNEDDSGKMRNMMGKLFKVSKVRIASIFIENYTWAPEDLIIDEDLEPLPLPQTNIMFDPKELL